jgi:hypothetical protein
MLYPQRGCFESWNGGFGKSQKAVLKAGIEMLVKAEGKEAIFKAGTEVLVKQKGKRLF